ncbi:transglycosylase SLT domain-containing protein [Vibrio methylphosphonaticus]|uniref:transglycosylase SLT domain-containing protein n=1 Tax=Vibrio methylphosphonaticus TaxID=2946866 RepID=UPI00202A2714|nr:transglycosylase SLT domain-containing protein [Vibrio methylphosphonaticus]MCL9774989.1 transglycosylase SLT domain-containing protein [Vibrio methylphosphonaticus]
MKRDDVERTMTSVCTNRRRIISTRSICVVLACLTELAVASKLTDLESKALPSVRDNSTKILVIKPNSSISTNKNGPSSIIELRGGLTSPQYLTKEIRNINPHKKAMQYFPIVQKASKTWGIDVSLILAVIHVESYFDPRARSSAPAYGLMQVMKDGAVAEISQRYYSQSTFTTEQLYSPSININIGTAYLSVLKLYYLKDIRSSLSREWLAIAAYNCGPSNLLKYFKRTNSVEKFSHMVNKMTEDALFDYLTTEFPISETRSYVKKVINHKSTYRNLH